MVILSANSVNSDFSQVEMVQDTIISEIFFSKLVSKTLKLTLSLDG